MLRNLIYLFLVVSKVVGVTKKMQGPSKRIINTERAYIEDVLDKYTGPDSDIDQSKLHVLALGSSYWGPPEEALDAIKDTLGRHELAKVRLNYGCR